MPTAKSRNKAIVRRLYLFVFSAIDNPQITRVFEFYIKIDVIVT